MVSWRTGLRSHCIYPRLTVTKKVDNLLPPELAEGLTGSIGLAIVGGLGLPLSHGVDGAAWAVVGVSRITAWLTQASDKVLPDRFRAVSVTTVGFLI